MMGGRRKRARSEDDDAMTVCVHESKGRGHASLPAGIEEEDVLGIMHEVVQDFAKSDKTHHSEKDLDHLESMIAIIEADTNAKKHQSRLELRLARCRYLSELSDQMLDVLLCAEDDDDNNDRLFSCEDSANLSQKLFSWKKHQEDPSAPLLPDKSLGSSEPLGLSDISQQSEASFATSEQTGSTFLSSSELLPSSSAEAALLQVKQPSLVQVLRSFCKQ